MATRLGDWGAAGGHVPVSRGWPGECALVCVLHENKFLGFLGEEGESELKEVSRDELESFGQGVSS